MLVWKQREPYACLAAERTITTLFGSRENYMLVWQQREPYVAWQQRELYVVWQQTEPYVVWQQRFSYVMGSRENITMLFGSRNCLAAERLIYFG